MGAVIWGYFASCFSSDLLESVHEGLNTLTFTGARISFSKRNVHQFSEERGKALSVRVTEFCDQFTQNQDVT